MYNTTTHFNLHDGTALDVRKISENNFDFLLTYANGTKKTFRWQTDSSIEYKDKKGNFDEGIEEAISLFQGALKDEPE